MKDYSDIKYEIECSHASREQYVDVYTYKITKGVWHLMIEFFDRFEQSASSGFDDRMTLYFDFYTADNTDEEVTIHFKNMPDHSAYGSVWKTTYLGTIYEDKLLERIYNESE